MQSVYEFAEEFTSIFPEARFVKRGSQFEIKRIVEIAIKNEFSDVIIINEDRKKPSKFYLYLDAVTVIHLPNGPTAHFKLTSIRLCKEIQVLILILRDTAE